MVGKLGDDILIIDTREPKDISIALSKKGINVKDDFIEVGDYLLPNGYAIERKKGKDFMSSVMSNRLYEQLNNLCQYEHPVLAIIADNIWRDFYFSKGRFIHKSYIGTLSTLTCKYPNLKIMFLESDEMFIGYLSSLHKKLTEDGDSRRPAPMMRKAKSIKTRMENMLTAIEGVGVPMSKKLLKKYGNINRIASISEKELQKMDKVGPKLASNIYETFNSPYIKKKNNKRKK